MKRRLLNLLTALSLLLCVAAVGLWFRSYWVVDELTRTGGARRAILTTAAGGFDIQITDSELFRSVPQGWRWRQARGQDGVNIRLLWRQSVSSAQHPYAAEPPMRSRLGVWWGALLEPDPNRASSVRTVFIMAPIWPLAVLWAVLPSLWTTRRYRAAIRRRRRMRGLCPRCRYDLRATRGRCPECGEELAPALGAECERQGAKGQTTGT